MCIDVDLLLHVYSVACLAMECTYGCILSSNRLDLLLVALYVFILVFVFFCFCFFFFKQKTAYEI